jgi:hypothetical protein
MRRFPAAINVSSFQPCFQLLSPFLLQPHRYPYDISTRQRIIFPFLKAVEGGCSWNLYYIALIQWHIIIYYCPFPVCSLAPSNCVITRSSVPTCANLQSRLCLLIRDWLLSYHHALVYVGFYSTRTKSLTLSWHSRGIEGQSRQGKRCWR